MAKRALCVGINQFAHLPMASWLYGCVNDANDMAGMLRKRGFAAQSITVLTDTQATKAAVMGALTEMVGAAKPGDHLVFSFSSHGTQVPDTDGDEPDGSDEAFACHDIAQAGNQWDTNTVIVDDELRTLLATLPKGVLFEAFLDTCHSGSGLRGDDLLAGRRPRYLPPPTARGLRAVESAPKKVQMVSLVKTLPAASRPVLYAGCQPDQTSADATFDNRSNGAFTYYFLKAVSAGAARSRKEIHAEITKALRAGDFTQRPTLEGPPKSKTSAVGDPW
ncbi:MAG TPA: caspase family protein [Dermatophilaceae bacterium]|nr:caspase family protein [Dermatophilaceae bacterium]